MPTTDPTPRYTAVRSFDQTGRWFVIDTQAPDPADAMASRKMARGRAVALAARMNVEGARADTCQHCDARPATYLIGASEASGPYVCCDHCLPATSEFATRTRIGA